MQRWTKQETERLRFLVGSGTHNDAIAAELGRTLQSVARKRAEAGLCKPHGLLRYLTITLPKDELAKFAAYAKDHGVHPIALARDLLIVIVRCNLFASLLRLSTRDHVEPISVAEKHNINLATWQRAREPVDTPKKPQPIMVQMDQPMLHGRIGIELRGSV